MTSHRGSSRPFASLRAALATLLVSVAFLVLADLSSATAQGLMTTPVGHRTGLTEGAVTTGPGTIVINGGASVRHANGVTTYRLGELDVRVPLSSRVEARLYANSYTWRDAQGQVTSGREHLSLASSAMLVSHAGLRPVTALIVRLDVPTGTLPSAERSWRPSARLALGWELPHRVALHANVGVARETMSGTPLVREFASVWVARHIVGPFGAYGEVAGSTRERPGGPMTGYLHGGVTCLVSSSLHLDLHAGIGSRSAGSVRWVGVGLRRRVG